MSTQVRKAFVLGAGLGKRMRPLTNDRPKPLVPLAGRPLIDHVLDRLARAGIVEAVVNVHYEAEKLEAHLAARMAEGRGPRVVISDERDGLLDTGGGIKKALAQLGEAPFVVHNADSIWPDAIRSNGNSPDAVRSNANWPDAMRPDAMRPAARGPDAGDGALAQLIAAWDGARMTSLLQLVPTGRTVGYGGAGDFVPLGDGRIRRRQPHEQGAPVYAGVSILSAAAFADTPEGPFSLNLVWDRAIQSRRLFGTVYEGPWMHIGTPEALAEAERLLARTHPSGAPASHRDR